MSQNKFPRKDETPPSSSGATPDTTPAPKEEIATDVSEVARERLSGSDKTAPGPSTVADAAAAAPGIAGTPADDDTAAKVEAAPTAVPQASQPGATRTDGGSASAPLSTNPGGTGASTKPTPPATPAPAASTAPAAPAAGTSAPAAPPTTTPAQGQTPAQAGLSKSADPTTTATSPTAPDAAPTAAAAAGAAAEAEKKPGAPATAAQPVAAAGANGAPAAAKPSPERPAAGTKPAGGARPTAAAKPAAPPKPPEPDPDEVTALREVVPGLTWERRHGYVEVRVPSAQLVPIARKVKAIGYDYLSAVTAVDWRDRVEMLYHCYGWNYVEVPGCVVIRADLPPEPNPLCPSLTTVWPGADFQEREIYDLFGVKFVGHPDLRRILLEERFPGHPLRKDWTFDYEYVLVRHLKNGAEGQDGPPGGEEGFRRV